jgi:hypothetical protein
MLKPRLFALAGCVAAAASLSLVLAPQAFSLNMRELALARMAWTSQGSTTSKYSCANSESLCTEVRDSEDIFGYRYVGHDEPAVLFYSTKAGSGNDMTYKVRLPREPAGAYSNGKSYDFELSPAFWFGMAMCDSYSYPQTTSKCTPDSDSNAVNVATSTQHPGSAYMELQFYPPGWVPQFAAQSCDPKKWCVALTIDSLSVNPINGTQLNPTCQNEVLGGVEYTNFAYLTRNGEPQGPPNPLEFDPVASGQPGSNVLYMNPGDNLTVSLHDSTDGLVTRIVDHTTGQTGFMTASAGNEFGHVVPAPNGTGCQVRYYNFHPMYSTSQPDTTVPWAAASYNVAMVSEIGHFDACTHIDPNSPEAACNGLVGTPGDQQPAESDDVGCFSAEESLLYPATGCTNENDPGFNGASYVKDWPDGSASHPTPFLFSSPTTFGSAYSQVAFNTDLPAIESPDVGGRCDNVTGKGCTNPPPQGSSGKPALFYPYYSTVSTSGGCRWAAGNLAGVSGTTNSFGGNSKAEFGPLQQSRGYVFNGGGATQALYFDYQKVLSNNPC